MFEKNEKILKKLLTKNKIEYKMCSTKSEQEFAEQKFKMEVTIMNIFKTKVREIKTVYTKVANITILGQKVGLEVAYKNIDAPELNCGTKEVKIVLPLKYQNKDIKKILNVILNKMYEQITKNEVEVVMEKIRSRLKFAPEDYKISFIKNTMAKCNNSREIIINPYITRNDRETIEYIILHEYCHLKYKTHSKGFWELIKKAMPQFERFEYVA